MASIAITASIPRACRPHYGTKKRNPNAKSSCSFASKQSIHLVSPDIKGRNGFPPIAKEEEEEEEEKSVNPARGAFVDKTSASLVEKTKEGKDELKQEMGGGNSGPKLFDDGRWKNGTWDLNMFVKDGRMDWDGVIVAEARRRKFIEVYPQVATTQDPVVFRSSIIPWWAWIIHSHLPEAELLNGRAAMVGFFATYFVDVLTGLDIIGQTGNVICKAGLFFVIVGIILFRRTEDLGNIRKLADEAILYDKQWQASWQDQDLGTHTSNQSGKK